MPNLNILSSGSSGNSSFIEYGNKIIFIDIGIRKNRSENSLKDVSLEGKDIFLFITHEHSDHIVGLNYFLKRYKPFVFTSEGTADILNTKGVDVDNFYMLGHDSIYTINDFDVLAFELLHDGAEPLGFKFMFKDKSITFATDFGTVTRTVMDYLNDSTMLILESNYEDKLLINGHYPSYVKKRIRSSKGHLSNKDAVNLISSLDSSKVENILLAHVSEDNNDYMLLEKYTDFCSKHFGISTAYLKQGESKMGIEV